MIKNDFKIESILSLFSLNPAKIMNLDLCDIKVGSAGELVIIDPKQKWTFTKDDIYSKSSNSPFINQNSLVKFMLQLAKVIYL